MLATKPLMTTMIRSFNLITQTISPSIDPTGYIRFIWRLLYLTTIKLDLSYEGQQLSQIIYSPVIARMQEATSVLRYLKISPLGVFLSIFFKVLVQGISASD